MIIGRYEITKNAIVYQPLTNCADLESAQKHIDFLSRKCTHGYTMVKKNKNNFTCKTIINSLGDIKYLYFTILPHSQGTTKPKAVLKLQKMC